VMPYLLRSIVAMWMQPLSFKIYRYRLRPSPYSSKGKSQGISGIMIQQLVNKINEDSNKLQKTFRAGAFLRQ